MVFSGLKQLESWAGHCSAYSDTSPSIRFIVPQLLGDAAIIHDSAKVFPPIQPILGDPVDYTHNILQNIISVIGI